MTARALRGLRRLATRLRRDTSGLALIEFAYAAPIMLTLGMYGLEAANLALVNMRVSQVTANLADTASRIGLDSTLALKEIRESDIDDAFQAVRLQGGSYNITTTGRVILSSLEQNANGGQWIHWQRCVGQGKDATNTFFTSNYGVQGDGAVGQPAITGMGPTGGKIAAPAKQAVMFVETQYTYKPLISSRLFGTPVIKSTAAFIVRDIRNLADANNPSNAAGATSMTCDKHTT